MYLVYRNQSQGPITHGIKSFRRFYDTMLPCPTFVLSGKDEFKIFQHYIFSRLIELQRGYSLIL